jgi:hypothetical protein
MALGVDPKTGTIDPPEKEEPEDRNGGGSGGAFGGSKDKDDKQDKPRTTTTSSSSSKPSKREKEISARLASFEELLGQFNPEVLQAQFEGLTPEQQAQFNQQLAGISTGLGGISTGVPLVQQQLAGVDPSLGTFQQQLAGVDPTGLGAAQGATGDIAGRLQAIGTGAIDPRFGALAEARLNQLGASQQQRTAQTSEFFGRRGVGGSAAELNALNQLSNQFDIQRQNIVAELGLQGLQRSDVALSQALGARGQQAQLGLAGSQFQQGLIGQQAALGLQQAQFQQGLLGQQAALGLQEAGFQQGIFGQQAGLTQQQLANVQAGIESRNLAEEQRLGALTAGLENASIPLQLLIAQTAAENAGQVGGGGGGGKK